MRSVRIAGGYGFYGDLLAPVRRTLERGEVHYVCSDHLAELTLAILQKDRLKDPALGYARDTVSMIASLWPLARERGVRFVSNGGGLNPSGAAQALRLELEKRRLHARIGVVEGDALAGRIDELRAAGEALDHMDTGASIDTVRERLLFANAYLGAQPIVEALAEDAQIVITGRVADAAVFLAPLVHELKWSWDDWDRLAQGLSVGHLLECSAQVTGGNFGGDWEKVPDFAHIGYAIAEASESGEFVLTKAPGTGGLINFDTVREQLLYEVHDPRNYVSPDVVLDMSTIRLLDEGRNEVRVAGASGKPRPEKLKVVAGYEDGYMGVATLGYSWPDALKKARAAAETMKTVLAENGVKYDELHVSYLGHDALLGPLADQSASDDLNEVFLRMAIRTRDKRTADSFGRYFPWIGLGGPPFVTVTGLTPARQLLGIWPTLVRREAVEPNVTVRMIDV